MSTNLTIITNGPKTIDQLDRDARWHAARIAMQGGTVTLVDFNSLKLEGKRAEVMIIDDPIAEEARGNMRDAIAMSWEKWLANRPKIPTGLDFALAEPPTDLTDIFNAFMRQFTPHELYDYQKEFVRQLSELEPRRYLAEAEIRQKLQDKDERPHWQKLNGGNKPWKRKRKWS